MDTKRIGNITELEVMAALLKQNVTVLQPYGDCERYDCIAETPNGKYIKIQCKASKSNDNGASFSFFARSSHYTNGKYINKHYTKDEIDYFGTSFNGKCYLIPVEEVHSTKYLRIAPPANNQSEKICWAKDYELEKIVQNWLNKE